MHARNGQSVLYVQPCVPLTDGLEVRRPFVVRSAKYEVRSTDMDATCQLRVLRPRTLTSNYTTWMQRRQSIVRLTSGQLRLDKERKKEGSSCHVPQSTAQGKYG